MAWHMVPVAVFINTVNLKNVYQDICLFSVCFYVQCQCFKILLSQTHITLQLLSQHRRIVKTDDSITKIMTLTFTHQEKGQKIRCVGF